MDIILAIPLQAQLVGIKRDNSSVSLNGEQNMYKVFFNPTFPYTNNTSFLIHKLWEKSRALKLICSQSMKGRGERQLDQLSARCFRLSACKNDWLLNIDQKNY